MKPRKRNRAVETAQRKLRRRAKGVRSRKMSGLIARVARGHEERFEADSILDDLARR